MSRESVTVNASSQGRILLSDVIETEGKWVGVELAPSAGGAGFSDEAKAESLWKCRAGAGFVNFMAGYCVEVLFALSTKLIR